MDFDTSVKLNIYETIASTTRMPTSTEVASAIDSSVPEVVQAFQRLYEKRLLVLEPGSLSHIRMAPPFSGIETQHRVKIEDKIYFANCDEPMTFQIRDGKPLPQECVIHFAVPASQWWKDIVYT